VLAEALTDLGPPTTRADCHARSLGKRWGEGIAPIAESPDRALPAPSRGRGGACGVFVGRGGRPAGAPALCANAIAVSRTRLIGISMPFTPLTPP